LYAAANDFLVWFLLGFVKQAASIPFAYLEAWHFSAMVIIVYYIMLIGLFNLSIPRVRTWMLILLLSLGNYILFADVWFHTNPICTVTVIDVGQGDAILLECPNEKRILIDTGPWSMHFDAGERTIVPFLKRKGITTLDYLLITHPHSDHIGGAKSVLRSIRVDTLVMTSNNSDNRQVKEVLEAAQQKNIGLKTAIAGSQIQIDLNARMYILYPKFNQPEERNLNNSSVVIKVIFNGASMLLVGDAETMVEQKLISKYAKFLSSDVLKVGHHGSISSTSEQFLKIVHPRIALISVGNNNKFRHPSPFTLSRLKANSIDIERTDKFGAIVLESDGNRWIKIEWKKKQ
jgi:competence protein ComEC